MRNQAGEKGETEEAKAETGTGKAAARRNRVEKERKSRRLSSWKRKASGRKEARQKQKIPKAKAQGKHLTSGCGKRGRDGRKETDRKPSTENRKEGMETGRKEGENRGSESGDGAPGKQL